MTTSQPVVIVGAGPSGTAAAAQLGKFGIKSIIIDEAPKIGGVIYRGPFRDSDDLPHLDDNLKRAMSALRTRFSAQKQHIELLTQTRVLGPEGQNKLLLNKLNSLSNLAYQDLILATGCHERSVPFPGWQLPGVMLLGGVQLQIKSGLVKPGTRMALVGTGPLLPLVACQLHKAGVDVVGVYEASQFHKLAKEAIALLNKPKLTLSGLSMMAYLEKHDIPFYYGWGIVDAVGDETLQQISVAPYNECWQADVQNAKTIDVDAIGVGYGFVARSQLAMLLGAQHQYSHVSGYVPILDNWLKSSLENTYIVGDANGLLGADAAICEGQIAAIRIAQKRNKITPKKAAQLAGKVHRKLARIKRFRYGFDRFSARQFGLLELPKDDTVVCRCEQATRSQIDKAIEQGAKDITTLKMRTRIGMGDCQGKTCASYAIDRLQQAGFTHNIGTIQPRFPLDPIPFTLLEDNHETV
ncbi:FAD/NAD(P)-dependent oxidoreductase [Pseudoalteromonas sp. S16_S37]|uniref:FAD/NAD(P)-dependent oxidoreductase n=1 Tax=Pseudoalteromonas sp. S16_S37 TaxID=2720228 RepID=UPI00167FE361|nr:FAD/NAD(P)-binding oxidoreductase [Pseudoalteromonas sp. S16_S37]MBD1581470.1 NAD(P)/FAD-dependent oxidoreductase [Pseudoalteromonas sp. S16_S37]